MDVYLITDAGIESRTAEELTGLLADKLGVVWVDVPNWDDEAAEVLTDVFKFHELAIRDARARTRVAKVHAYSDHYLVVLHSPEMGDSGHVHYLELDQFVGPGYLVTVHGPINPVVDPRTALRETEAVRRRIETGRLRIRTSADLSYALVSTLCRHMEQSVEDLTAEVWRLEQQVTSGHLGDPEQFLEELFRARHGLLAVKTMAALSKEIYGRLSGLARVVPPSVRPLMDDAVDQFERIQSLADAQKDYHQGVIDFYRSRSDTKMTIAAERLAVIAVVTLPITAVASIVGMNVIVNDATRWVELLVLLVIMSAMSGVLLAWAKRQGWW